MTNYDTEQGGESGGSNRMDTDLNPWLRREWGLDVFLSEFPYFQYAGIDFDPEDDEGIRDHLSNDWTPDSVEELEGYRDYLLQKGPFRTDVVAVSVDRQALRTRIRRTGTTESMNGSGQAKRRNRRTYLTFVGDGPMTREYWEGDHGSTDELRGYGESSASRGFGWLKKRGFLANVGGPTWDAVDIPLHIYGRTHAFELKREAREWETALEQAARADVFADYRWVVYDRATAPTDSGQLETFRERGVGLITLHPEDHPDVEVWADRCTREVDRDALDRYNVERWDVNERVLTRLNKAHAYYHEHDADHRERFPEPDCPDILAQLDPDAIDADPSPPTANGSPSRSSGGDDHVDPAGPNEPLTAFTDGGGDE